MVTLSLSKPYRKCQSEPTGDTEARKKRVTKARVAIHQAESTQDAEARRKKEAGAQAAKRQVESTQEVDVRRKREAEAQAKETPKLSGQEKLYSPFVQIYDTIADTSSFKPGSMS